jgi:hypothetical protein
MHRPRMRNRMHNLRTPLLTRASTCVGHTYTHGTTSASFLAPTYVCARLYGFTCARAHKHMHVYLYVCVRARGWASSPCFCMHARTCSCIYQHLKARPTAAPDFGCERTRPRDNAQTACIHASTRALRYMKEPAHPVNSLGVLRGLRPRFPHLGQLLRRSPVPRVPRTSERASERLHPDRPTTSSFLRGRTEAAPGLSTDANRRGSRLHAAHAAALRGLLHAVCILCAVGSLRRRTEVVECLLPRLVLPTLVRTGGKQHRDHSGIAHPRRDVQCGPPAAPQTMPCRSLDHNSGS